MSVVMKPSDDVEYCKKVLSVEPIRILDDAILFCPVPPEVTPRAPLKLRLTRLSEPIVAF